MCVCVWLAPSQSIRCMLLRTKEKVHAQMARPCFLRPAVFASAEREKGKEAAERQMHLRRTPSKCCIIELSISPPPACQYCSCVPQTYQPNQRPLNALSQARTTSRSRTLLLTLVSLLIMIHHISSQFESRRACCLSSKLIAC